MRICCCLAGHLELARRRDLYGTPVVVGDADGHVLAVSEEALPFSVEPGLPVRQAEHLCPHATLLSSDPVAADGLRERIAAALYDLAPCVEVRVDGIAWLDLEGVPSPSESIREARRRLRTAIGREPRLGLAPGPFSARLAAARARPGRLLKIDDARAFLAPLPTRELWLDDEQMERLDLLGLRTLGAVAAIGPRELESQLGREGKRAVLLARGLEPDQLTPWQPPMFTSPHPQLEAAGRRQLRLWTGGDGNSDEVTAALERLQERHGDTVVRKPRPVLPSSPIPSQRFA